MPRGGRREGAGRKRGSETARTKRMRQIAAKALTESITPLEVMLAAMRKAYDASDMPAALEAAKAAAPYVHPRLASIEHAGPGGGPIETHVSGAKASLESKLASIAARIGPGGVSERTH
jgi:hypothetical protein